MRNSAGEFSFIDIPGASSTFITGINDAGHLIGYFIDGAHGFHGLIATPVLEGHRAAVPAMPELPIFLLLGSGLLLSSGLMLVARHARRLWAGECLLH